MRKTKPEKLIDSTIDDMADEIRDLLDEITPFVARIDRLDETKYDFELTWKRIKYHAKKIAEESEERPGILDLYSGQIEKLIHEVSERRKDQGKESRQIKLKLNKVWANLEIIVEEFNDFVLWLSQIKDLKRADFEKIRKIKFEFGKTMTLHGAAQVLSLTRILKQTLPELELVVLGLYATYGAAKAGLACMSTRDQVIAAGGREVGEFVRRIQDLRKEVASIVKDVKRHLRDGNMQITKLEKMWDSLKSEANSMEESLIAIRQGWKAAN